MENIHAYETDHLPTWCSGCGDFGVWLAIKKALAAQHMEPHEVVVVFDIGCSGNMADKLKVYGFHGLHGRAIPVAEGIKLANHRLPVIVVGGDGGGYGEGLGHFLHSVRGNHDITYIVHDNEVYGLTKGQTSPTSEEGFVTGSTPDGVLEQPIHPLALAIAAGVTFAARAFASEPQQLADLIVKGMQHRGFAIIDVLQPCVTFNKIQTYQWFRERLYHLADNGYTPNDRTSAYVKAQEWEKGIPLGILYKEEKAAFHEREPELAKGTLVDAKLGGFNIAQLFDDHR